MLTRENYTAEHIAALRRSTGADPSKSRKMVLEVNSGNDDLLSIVSDLQSTGVIFV